MLLHHTLGNGNFHVFADMAAHLAVEVAKLIDPRDIAAQIDHALRECYLQSRPVYLSLPTDMVRRKVEGQRLKTKLDLSPHKNDPDKEDYVVEVVLGYLTRAKNPVILVDSCAIRHRVLDETHELIEKSGLPVFVAPMADVGLNDGFIALGNLSLPAEGGRTIGVLTIKGEPARIAESAGAFRQVLAKANTLFKTVL